MSPYKYTQLCYRPLLRSLSTFLVKSVAGCMCLSGIVVYTYLVKYVVMRFRHGTYYEGWYVIYLLLRTYFSPPPTSPSIYYYTKYSINQCMRSKWRCEIIFGKKYTRDFFMGEDNLRRSSRKNVLPKMFCVRKKIPENFKRRMKMKMEEPEKKLLSS